MGNRGYVVLGMLALSTLAIALVAGHHAFEGPALLEITETHGLHVGGLPILAAWVVGAGLCWRLWTRERQ